MLGRILETLFPVRQGERRLTAVLFLHSLFAVGAFTTGRSVRDALFLAHGNQGSLALMIVVAAVAVTFVGAVYGKFAARLRRDRTALVSAMLFAAMFVVAFGIERGGPPFIYPALYIFVEVMGALLLMQFWTLANELFNAREAKRLYGLIGAGGTMANIVVGYLSAKVAIYFGASALLPFCAFLCAGTAVASFLAGRMGRERIFAKAASGKAPVQKRSGGASRVLASGHLRTVAVLAAVTFFTTTLVDYEFKVVARASLSKNELAAFFGYFSMVVGFLALGLQLFGTSKLLNRAGVIVSLAVLPVSLAFGNVALAIFPVLWAASMAKGADTLFRYSINDATTQILYLPVPSHARVQAKAFIDGVVKPVSIGLCGVMLLGYSRLSGDPKSSYLAWASIILCAVWVALVVSLRSQYIRSLQSNLRNRRLDLESARYKVLDGSTNLVLVRALESGDPREVLNALELLPHLENVKLDHKVEPLLEHSMVEVRVAALEYYARRQTMRFANSIFRKFDDPAPKVRAAAIEAFCAIGRDKAVRNVRAFLSDTDPAIRSAAVVGMIRYGGLDGVLVAAEALKALINHPEVVMREHAATVLGLIGVANFYQPVLELMNDPEPSVQRQAIHSAGLLKSPEFVIPLIYKTQSPETMREAIEALSSFGPGVVQTLGKVLANRVEDPLIRRAVARVLGRLGTGEAVEIITQHLEATDEELRMRLYKALARAVKGRRLLTVDRKLVAAALDREIDRAYRAHHASETLGLGGGPTSYTPRSGPKAAEALLASALDEKVAMTEHRIFLLLSVLYPDADMEFIYAGIHDAAAVDAPRRRANAVELLDNLLERNLKKRLLPLVDELPRVEKLRAVAEVLTLPTWDRDATVAELCRDETAWVRACAVYYAVQLSVQGALEHAVAANADASPVVREMSLVLTLALAPERALALADSHLADEAPVVRRQAAWIATRRGAA